MKRMICRAMVWAVWACLMQAGASGDVSESILRSLNSPDGIAFDYERGHLFVSEEDSSRIVVWNGHHQRTSVTRSTIVTDRKKALLRSGLQFPEAIAFHPRMGLLVAEDRPDGRLIQFELNDTGVAMKGYEIPIPSVLKKFAWEGLDVNEDGDILLAGSDLEGSARKSVPGFYQGVILLRKADAEWWMIHQKPFYSFSSVAFSPDGKKAAYCCEMTGEVGWLDLEKKYVSGGVAPYAADEPEGVCFLPDGSVAVAEEKGLVHRIDPARNEASLLYSHRGRIETVLWHEREKRLYVTDDQHGELISVSFNRVFSPGDDRMKGAVMASFFGTRYIPDECPAFMKPVLMEQGLLDSASQSTSAWSKVVRELPVIGFDAETHYDVESVSQDPVTRIAAVIMPNTRGMFSGRSLQWNTPYFRIERQSGTVRTIREQGLTRIRDLQKGGDHPVKLYSPVVSTMPEEGETSVELYGVDSEPNYLFRLNPRNSPPGLLTVIHPDGELEEYTLHFPEHISAAAQWLISVGSEEEKTLWKLLGKARN